MESVDRAAPPLGALGPTPAEPADVALLHHPTDEQTRRRLAAVGLPRLLVVDADGEPPGHGPDVLEDWARTPFRPEDAIARQAALLGRYLRRTQGVRIDADGTLVSGGDRVALTPAQRAMMVPLVGSAGSPVSREVVEREYRSVAGAVAPSLASALVGLRRPLRRAGLTLHVLRPGAVLLEVPVGSRRGVH
jgi:hypothetical protein